MGKVPSDVVVVLDEAYFEYVHEDDFCDGLTLLAEFPNLIVTRTFSKAYGLAALRVGYGISSAEIANLMNRVRPPFNVNSFALAAAVATLNDEDYVNESKAINDQGMKYLTQNFDELDLPYIPSVGNFVSFEIPKQANGLPTNITAAQVNDQLLAAGVIIRLVANYEMPNHLRVSIGTPKENEIFIIKLKKILADARS